MTTHYRKRPVVIEARQLTDSNAGAIVNWITQHGQKAVMRGGPGGGSKGATVMIRTLEGLITYPPGHWIIRGVQGEFYACRDDIFQETYEPVEGAIGDPK